MGLTGFNRRRRELELGKNLESVGASAPADLIQEEIEKRAELIAKALELELGDAELLELMTTEELEALFEDETNESDGKDDEKTTLIAKALELKLDSPSNLSRMGVKKLRGLIAEYNPEA